MEEPSIHWQKGWLFSENGRFVLLMSRCRPQSLECDYVSSPTPLLFGAGSRSLRAEGRLSFPFEGPPVVDVTWFQKDLNQYEDRKQI
ncbi:Hypothetical protein NTJ_09669 [Nesidiocoris tenuis]|uniref:Uncharacterized protein n=1 Tax=Nesidiocoris tenuis TaxID=355587 RepID=A0ABN7B120_9HEMI|nr:Hypothetical protein NTJ_09669 [Nesidiocoris tenuis]